MRRVAAIDCGTNSIRLLIADIDSGAGTLTDIERTMTVVRLGEGVDRTGSFSAAALERTFAACDDYASAIADADVDTVRFVATSASRDVSNRDEFVAGVKARLGIVPDVITGDEEASLSFIGAVRSLGDQVGDQEALVVDIGGGSTEFVRGSIARGVIAAKSVDIGCVRMTERRLVSNPPTNDQVGAAIEDIDAAIQMADEVVDLSAADILIGLAGSVTTLAALALELPEYDAAATHGSELSAADVFAITNALLAMPNEERAELAVMHPGRVDVIGGGALVLDRILACTEFASVLVSEHDILDGIAWSLADPAPS